MRLLVRTATNAYFGQVESALSIPDPGREIEDRLEPIWRIVKNADANTLPVFRNSVDDVGPTLEGYSDEDVLAAIAARRADLPVGREPLRIAEMRQLQQSPQERPGEVADPDEDFFARRIDSPAAYPEIADLVLVHKLRTVAPSAAWWKKAGVSGVTSRGRSRWARCARTTRCAAATRRPATTASDTSRATFELWFSRARAMCR